MVLNEKLKAWSFSSVTVVNFSKFKVTWYKVFCSKGSSGIKAIVLEDNIFTFPSTLGEMENKSSSNSCSGFQSFFWKASCTRMSDFAGIKPEVKPAMYALNSVGSESKSAADFLEQAARVTRTISTDRNLKVFIKWVNEDTFIYGWLGCGMAKNGFGSANRLASFFKKIFHQLGTLVGHHPRNDFGFGM